MGDDMAMQKVSSAWVFPWESNLDRRSKPGIDRKVWVGRLWVAPVAYAMDLLVMMLMVSSLADSILETILWLSREWCPGCLDRARMYLCCKHAVFVPAAVDTIVVLVLSSNWPWGSVGNNRPGYDSFLSGMEKMMTIILDLLAMLEVVPNR
jgi:hypothetical protein